MSIPFFRRIGRNGSFFLTFKNNLRRRNVYFVFWICSVISVTSGVISALIGNSAFGPAAVYPSPAGNGIDPVYLKTVDDYPVGPFPYLRDNGFGVAHLEMILPHQWFTAMHEEYWNYYLHKSAIMARAAGIMWNRFEFAWSSVQPSPDVWDWSDLDAYLNFSDHYGLRILPVVAYGTPWACRDGDYLAPIENMTAWRNYVRTLVLRYKDRPSLSAGWWQVWNEANIHGFFHGDFIEDFIPIMVAAAEEIKKADPSAHVVANAITSSDMYSVITEMVDAVGRDKFNELFDAVDIHPYSGTWEGAVEKIRDAKRALDGWYNGVLWITEFGYSTHGYEPLEPARLYQADIIGKVMVMSRVLGVNHTLIHMWCDWGWVNGTPKVQDPDNGEHWFGIVDMAANPKPAYYTYSMITNSIGYARYLGNPHVNGGFPQDAEFELFADPNGTLYMFFWTELPGVIRYRIDLPFTAEITVLNLTGDVTESSTGNTAVIGVVNSLSAVRITPNTPVGPDVKAVDIVLTPIFTPSMIWGFVILPILSVATVVPPLLKYFRNFRWRVNKK